jgi:hypothetical protein
VNGEYALQNAAAAIPETGQLMLSPSKVAMPKSWKHCRRQDLVANQDLAKAIHVS